METLPIDFNLFNFNIALESNYETSTSCALPSPFVLHSIQDTMDA